MTLRKKDSSLCKPISIDLVFKTVWLQTMMEGRFQASTETLIGACLIPLVQVLGSSAEIRALRRIKTTKISRN